MSAFLREVLVNYASNMITEYWTVAPSFENNDNFCMVLIICKSSFAKAVGAIHMLILSFFVNHNFSWDRNTAWKLLKYGVFSGPYFSAFGLNTERDFVSVIALVLQVKFRFVDCLVKANAQVSGNRSSLSSQLTLWARRAAGSDTGGWRGRSPLPCTLMGRACKKQHCFEENWINFQKISVFTLILS